jgi:sec-independent protein translocase protein TatA
MLGDLKGWEFFILAGLVIVLFGGKRLPDAARGLGRSLRIFKAETRGLRDDDEAADATTTTVQQVTPAQVLPQTQSVPAQPVVPTPAPAPAPAPQAQPVQHAPEVGEH